MRHYGIGVSISGHYHAGLDVIKTDHAHFLMAPALCESPFGFLEITLDGHDVRVTKHQLQLPPQLGLVDFHIHTPFAYCSENMDIARTPGLAADFGLADFAFAEHSGQLYFDRDTFWGFDFLTQGIDYPHGTDRRIDAYLQALADATCPRKRIALEVDCDDTGRPVIRPQDRAKAGFIIGATHSLK